MWACWGESPGQAQLYSGMIPELSSNSCSSLLPLQKMLMKQQDRLEEREQDIEEQLYKLESDKRLVEVTGPALRPAPSWDWGGQ